MNVKELLAAYDDGVITRGELIGKLRDSVDTAPFEELYAMPEDIKEELIEEIESILDTPPDEVFLVGGVLLAPGVDPKAWHQQQVDELNARRPAMRALWKQFSEEK